MDEYLRQLQDLGVNARAVEPGRVEASYAGGHNRNRRTGKTIGFIRCDGFPAPLVCLRHDRVEFMGSQDFYFAEYFVHDIRLTAALAGFEVKVEFDRTMAGYGDTLRARWSGDDRQTGLLQRLSDDPEIARRAMLFYGDHQPLEIRNDCEKKIWIVRSSADEMPIREQFDAYQDIARILLSGSLIRGHRPGHP